MKEKGDKKLCIIFVTLQPIFNYGAKTLRTEKRKMKQKTEKEKPNKLQIH